MAEPPKQARVTALGDPDLIEAQAAVQNLKSGKSKAIRRLSELDRRKKELDVTSEEAIVELTEIEADRSAAHTVLETIEEKLVDAEEKLEALEQWNWNVD